VERLEFTASTSGDYYIGIKRYSGTRAVNVHLYAYEPGAECAVETIAARQEVPKGILAELRRFRSDVLALSSSGRELIRAYDRHSAEVRRILLRNPSLGLQAARLLRDLRPAVRSMLGGAPVEITQDHATRIDAFVVDLAALATPELREALTQLRGRAGITMAAGQTAAQYWSALLDNGPRLIATDDYPEPGSMLHRVEASSIVPPGDSPYALTIGAVAASSGQVRDFSSRGPTSDGRRKPDLAGPDGVCTTVYGDCGGDGFSGTSAAAPHATGAVALLRNAEPSLSLSGIHAFFAVRAVDIAPAGPDNLTGAGRLALEATGPELFPPPVLSSPTGLYIPLTPTYVWSEVPGATSYRLMIATSPGALTDDPASNTCSGCVVNVTRNAAYFAPLACLLPDTTYYWQVQATAGSKNGHWARSSFTTAPAPQWTSPERWILKEHPGDEAFSSRAVIITHGYLADATSWVREMADRICASLGPTTTLSAEEPSDSFTRVCRTAKGWDVWVVDWRDRAGFLEPRVGLLGRPKIVQGPRDVVQQAAVIGEQLAGRLVAKNYEHVHLVAHSAGSNLIQSATDRLKRIVPGMKIHETFLDAYDPWPLSRYGRKADWADNYVDTRSLIGWIGYDGTKWLLDNAFNVNVTPAGNDACGMVCRHSRPYRFYGNSIHDSFGDLNEDPVGLPGGMGFELSTEMGKTLSWLATNYAKSLTCTFAGDTCNYTVLAPRSGTMKNVRPSQPVSTFEGPVTFTRGTTSLFDSIKLGSASVTTSSPSVTDDGPSAAPTEPPAWIVVDFITAEPVSAMRFHWRFRTAGEGFLRIFVDGRLVRELDQRYVGTASSEVEEVYIGGPEGELKAGAHTIVLRLDGFGASSSAVELTQVALLRHDPVMRRRVVRH
jgi:hypothetical protein